MEAGADGMDSLDCTTRSHEYRAVDLAPLQGGKGGSVSRFHQAILRGFYSDFTLPEDWAGAVQKPGAWVVAHL